MGRLAKANQKLSGGKRGSDAGNAFDDGEGEGELETGNYAWLVGNEMDFLSNQLGEANRVCESIKNNNSRLEQQYDLLDHAAGMPVETARRPSTLCVQTSRSTRARVSKVPRTYAPLTLPFSPCDACCFKWPE